jgi:acetyl-CoA C-acetyltransferase
MAENWIQRTPVIIGVGEVLDRPSDLQLSKEPLQLMAEALRRADEDAGGSWLDRIESLDVVNSMTWGYTNLPAQLSHVLHIKPKRAVYGAIGGNTPVSYLHEAAIQIALGNMDVAAVCGAEASQSLRHAQKTSTHLRWTPEGPKPPAPRREGVLHPTVIQHGLTNPLAAYPLYEYASSASWGQSFEDWQIETAELWSRFSSVAASNAYAWLRRVFEPSEISTPSAENRRVAGPYTKRMVANPAVNQGAAILLTSFGRAKAMGVPEERMVFVWGGSAASEPQDIAARDQYRHSSAMDAVLLAGKHLAQKQAELDFVELYSCFPCVPKMARRVLEWPAEKDATVTGGLTFFGGPYNNYMTHAAAAMTRRLREQTPGVGLLYGQGGFVTEHHTLILAMGPPIAPLDSGYDVQMDADSHREQVPALNEGFVGKTIVETYTILFDRHGEPESGVVFTRNAAGARVIARVDAGCSDSFAYLTDPAQKAIGTIGRTRQGNDGLLQWEI